VHGHDGEVRETVARFISEKLGFEPVILHERPNKGRTIITKFREEGAGGSKIKCLQFGDATLQTRTLGNISRNLHAINRMITCRRGSRASTDPSPAASG